MEVVSMLYYLSLFGKRYNGSLVGLMRKKLAGNGLKKADGMP